MKLKISSLIISISAASALNVAQSNTLLNQDASFEYSNVEKSNFSSGLTVSLNQNKRLPVTQGISLDNALPTYSLSKNSSIDAFTRLNNEEQQAGISLHLGGNHISALAGEGEGFSRLSNQYSDLDPYYFHGGSGADFRFHSLEWMRELGDNTSLTIGRAIVDSNHLETRSTQFVAGQFGRINAHLMQIDRGDSSVGQALSLGFDLATGSINASSLQHEEGGYIRQLSYAYQSKHHNRYKLAFSTQRNPLIEEDQQLRLMVGVSRRLGGGGLFNAAAQSASAEPTEETKSSSKLVLVGGVAVGAALVVSSGSDKEDSNIRFADQHAAARQVLNGINPQSARENVEYGGWVYRTPDDRYLTTTPVKGDEKSVRLPLSLLPANTSALASYHTHGGNDPNYITEQFSPTDILSDQQANVDGYLGTPQGKFLYHDVRNSSVVRLGTIAK